MSSTYGPGGSAGKRSCPFSFVVSVAGPPISAGELTRTTAPGKDAALCVLDGSDEGAGQPLRVSRVRLQHTCSGEKELKRSAHAKTPRRVGVNCPRINSIPDSSQTCGSAVRGLMRFSLHGASPSDGWLRRPHAGMRETRSAG